MELIGTFAGYKEYKAAFDTEVRRTEEGFVRIGYMLRVAEDTDILKESGYANMEEFAWNEYRIDKTQASRFMNINRRFSVDGYSDRLPERFQGYGVAKLGEMLTLSDDVIEVLPPKLTREKIQDIKKEIKEEKGITDLEVLMEKHDEAQEAMESNLGRFIHQYIHDNPNALEGFCKAAQTDGDQMTGCLMDTLAPSGFAVQMARLQGIGKLMLSISGRNQPMDLLNVRTNEKETCTWDDLKEVIRNLITAADPEECWTALYEEPYPPAEEEREARRQREAEAERLAETERKNQKESERKAQGEAARKQEVAPVQHEQASEMDRGEESHGELSQELREPEEFPMSKPEEDTQDNPQAAVQMDVENYPGVVPEKYITCHDGTQVTPLKESLRDEGCRLAEEVMLWMRTGTMSYAQETRKNIARLEEIMKEIVQDEECD